MCAGIRALCQPTRLMITIYHNTRCGKSRTALKMLEEANAQVAVIEYLKTPPSADDLRRLLQMLAMKPLDLIRTKEPVFQENYAGKTLSDEEWIEAMVAHPILIERPVVVLGDKAWVARDAETLEKIRQQSE